MGERGERDGGSWLGAGAHSNPHSLSLFPDLLLENKRTLDRAIRDLDRERTGLQTQEKKLIAEIKKAAKDGQMDAVRVMAKSLVRNRHSVTKLHGCKAQLQAVSLRLATLKSTQAMGDAMRGATKAMVAMNRRMNMPALTKAGRGEEKMEGFALATNRPPPHQPLPSSPHS